VPAQRALDGGVACARDLRFRRDPRPPRGNHDRRLRMRGQGAVREGQDQVRLMQLPGFACVYAHPMSE
jgi:hypothetical protein